jgi:hypothetical protein
MASSPAPIQAPIASNDGRTTQVWVRWFAAILARLDLIDGGGP